MSDDTKKIVINKCYGGFGLSARGTARLAELQGRACYFYRTVNHDFNRYERITVEQAEKQFIFFAYDVPDATSTLLGQHNEDWHRLPLDERQARNAEYRTHTIDPSDLPRHDPNLIRVVEELGAAANGSCAALCVVEIPADVEYEISEYDGRETIHEVHRSWY